MNKGYGGNGVSGKKAFLAVVAVYLVCVILGCLIIWLIPFVKNRSDLLEIAADKGEEILSAGQKEEVMIFGMDYALYSASGFRLYRINNFLYASEWDQIAHCAEEVFREGQIFSPAILLLDNRDDKQNLYIPAVLLRLPSEARPPGSTGTECKGKKINYQNATPSLNPTLFNPFRP